MTWKTWENSVQVHREVRWEPLLFTVEFLRDSGAGSTKNLWKQCKEDAKVGRIGWTLCEEKLWLQPPPSSRLLCDCLPPPTEGWRLVFWGEQSRQLLFSGTPAPRGQTPTPARRWGDCARWVLRTQLLPTLSNRSLVPVLTVSQDGGSHGSLSLHCISHCNLSFLMNPTTRIHKEKYTKSNYLRILKTTHTHPPNKQTANWGSQHLTKDKGSGCQFSICSFFLCPTGEPNQDTVQRAQWGNTLRQNCLSGQKTGRGVPLSWGAQGNFPVPSHTHTFLSLLYPKGTHAELSDDAGS